MERWSGASWALALIVATTPALAQKKPEAKDMTLLGYNDLQARSAYQPTIHGQNGHWIAYIGHHGGTEGEPKPLNKLTGQHEFNGTSLVDVTDPRPWLHLHRRPRQYRDAHPAADR